MRRFTGRTELRRASLRRLADAKALLAAPGQHGRAAMYLAGYAVECKLKAVAMEKFACWTLAGLAGRVGIDDREVMQHGLESLMVRFGLRQALATSAVMKDFALQVNRWSPQWRYDASEPTLTRECNEAADFVHAAERIVQWLGNNPGA